MNSSAKTEVHGLLGQKGSYMFAGLNSVGPNRTSGLAPEPREREKEREREEGGFTCNPDVGGKFGVSETRIRRLSASRPHSHVEWLGSELLC